LVEIKKPRSFSIPEESVWETILLGYTIILNSSGSTRIKENYAVFSGFCRLEVEACAVLDFYATLVGRSSPTFRINQEESLRKLLDPSTRVG
jgi:hypothetical protein